MIDPPWLVALAVLLLALALYFRVGTPRSSAVDLSSPSVGDRRR